MQVIYLFGAVLLIPVTQTIQTISVNLRRRSIIDEIVEEQKQKFLASIENLPKLSQEATVIEKEAPAISHRYENLIHQAEYLHTPSLRQDNVVLMLIKLDYRAYKFAPASLRSDTNFTMRAVVADWRVFTIVSEEMRSNKDIVRHVLTKNAVKATVYIPPVLLNDVDFVVQCVLRHPKILLVLPDKLLRNRKVMMSVIKNDYKILTYNDYALGLWPEVWKNDYEAVLTYMQYNGTYPKNIPKQIKDDVEVASLSEYCHDSTEIGNRAKQILACLKEERTREKAALLSKFYRRQNYGNNMLNIQMVFSYMPGVFIKDVIPKTCYYFFNEDYTFNEEEAVDYLHYVREIDRYSNYVKEIEQIVFVLTHLSKELYNNKIFMQDLVFLAGKDMKVPGEVLKYVSDEFQNYRDIVLAAVLQDGMALQHASRKLRDDRDIVLAAVRQNGLALQYASRKRRDDGDIVFTAVLQVPQYASYRDIVLDAVQPGDRPLQYASRRLIDIFDFFCIFLLILLNYVLSCLNKVTTV